MTTDHRERITRLAAASLALIAILASLAAWLAFGKPADAAPAYLFAWLLCLSIALGSNSLLMLHHLTGGKWGLIVHNPLTAAARSLPVVALLGLPLLLMLPTLYPWARPDTHAQVASDLLEHRHSYFNTPFFLARAILYFSVWLIIMFRTTRSLKSATPPRPILTRDCAIGLLVYLFLLTHAATDWIMSRDTEFYSTAFGLIIGIGQNFGALAFALIIALFANSTAQSPAPAPKLTKIAPSFFNDVGNILFTLVILWTYVSFMQFLVIWMGNLREDNGYFIKRGFSQPSPWRLIAMALILLHFFIPFLALLFKAIKRSPSRLAIVAAICLAAHILDAYWLVAPSADSAFPVLHITIFDTLAPIALGSIFFLTFLFNGGLRSNILLPTPEESVANTHAEVAHV